MKTPIHIAYCISDNYISYTNVSIRSIIENNMSNELYFHIVSNYISENNKKRINIEFANFKNVNLVFHIIDDNILSNLTLKSWSIHAWYRILLPEILPRNIDKVLYLDADTLVKTDLCKLFSISMDNKSIAGVLDIQSFFEETFVRCCYDMTDKYICSGVLLMNLAYWRRNNLTSKIIDYALASHDKLKFPDQDSINVVCKDSKIVLPLRYGILQPFFEYSDLINDQYEVQLNDCYRNPGIIHYAAAYPWFVDANKHRFHEEWMQYNKLLKKPARRIYSTKGFNKAKVIVYNMLRIKDIKLQLLKMTSKLDSF